MRRALPCWTTSMLTARSVALASPHHHHHYNCHCHYYRCYHDCILKMGRLTSLTRCGTTLPATTRSGSSARTPTSWWTLPSRPARSTPPESRTSPPLFIRLFIFVPTPSSETAGDILQKFWEFSNKFYPVKILVNWISLLSKRGPRARLLTNPKILSNFPFQSFQTTMKTSSTNVQSSSPCTGQLLHLASVCRWKLGPTYRTFLKRRAQTINWATELKTPGMLHVCILGPSSANLFLPIGWCPNMHKCERSRRRGTKCPCPPNSIHCMHYIS